MTADKKLTAIRSILSNVTYMQDSKLYQELEAALNRLPLVQLERLDVIVDMKVREAAMRERGNTDTVQRRPLNA